MAKKSAVEPTWEEIGKAIGSKIEQESKEGSSKGWNLKGQMCGHGGGGAVYGLGFVGALIYYLTTAPDIWIGIIGIFKAMLWPAFFVYGALKFLGV